MKLFNFTSKDSVGTVFSVDSGTLVIRIEKIEELRKLQINQLVAIRSSKTGQHMIGMINRITRKAITNEEDDNEPQILEVASENYIKVVLIGNLLDKDGERNNVFKRNIDVVPEIDAECFPLSGHNLTAFMQTISALSTKGVNPLSLGKYSIDNEANAYIDGDKLFQRHAVIVGSTGSGKSWCVAKLVEQITELPMSNCILFDIHGEYSTDSFKKEGISHYRIATPSDLATPNKLDKNIIMLPYWLLTYEEMLALLLDRSDNNAPNQAMLFSKNVFEHKGLLLKEKGSDLVTSYTVDSPIPYKIEEVLAALKAKDVEMVPGKTTDKQGPFNGKLTRFIQRLEAKQQDKRLGFLFGVTESELELDWMNTFCAELMQGKAINDNKGVKVIDFSEVPSDILPLIIGLIARIIFSIQQWSTSEKRHPIALLCDEAHLYIPERTNADSVSEIGLNCFERIAKEGRKYGVSLVVISQRPSEVNRTVLSQCNNFIALRLSNGDDQTVIKKLLPDNLGGMADALPILDIGEAIIVGDASLLPSRINIEEPKIKPSSATIKFWQEWGNCKAEQDIESAVEALRKQSKS